MASFILVLNACESLAQKKNEQTVRLMNSKVTEQDYSKLLARAREKGHIRIIAQLNTPFVPDGQLSAQEALDQQARISGAQAQLCADLAKYNATGIKKFKYSPHIAMEVDSTALKALIAHPLVLSLQEDAPSHPTK